MSYNKPHTKKPVKSYSGENEFEESHESFGMLSISRCQGDTPLFGSQLDSLGSFISLKIMEGSVRHSLSRDWYHEGKVLVEVRLSAAQFAQAITTLNSSPSTPCTVVQILGNHLEPVPERKTESKQIEEGFREKIRTMASRLAQGRDKAASLLDKKTITKSDKQELLEVFRSVIQDVKDNMPFVLTSFQESTQKTVAQAKIEVDAFAGMVLQLAGLDAIKNRVLGSGDNYPVLPDSTED